MLAWLTPSSLDTSMTVALVGPRRRSTVSVASRICSRVSGVATAARARSALTVEARHAGLVVASTSDRVGRDRRLDGGCQAVVEVDIGRAQRLGEPVTASSADERHDVA